MKTDPIFGLGDLAYYVFRPVVYSIDLVWGTDLRACDKCKERRAKWNAIPRSTALAILLVTSGLSLIFWLATK